MDVEKVIQKAFVSCPFDMLVDTYLHRLLETGINPEIGLNRAVLNRFNIPDFVKVARVFEQHGVKCTIHGPFTDISIGAIDKEVRAASMRRMKMALDIAALFGAGSVVCHSGYDYRQYLEAEGEWIENIISSLEELSAYAQSAGTRLMLENVFEPDPGFHEQIFSAVTSPALGFCLDLGHLKVFSPASTLEQWLDAVGHRIGELHIHDNHGKEDDHLPVGQGILDFDSLFAWIEKKGICPVLTLEAHDEAAVFPSLEGLGRLLDRYAICQGAGSQA